MVGIVILAFEGQREPKGAAGTFTFFQPYFAVHHLNQTLANNQSQPGSTKPPSD